MKYIVMLAVASACGYAAINQHQQPPSRVAAVPEAQQWQVAQLPPVGAASDCSCHQKYVTVFGIPGNPNGIKLAYFPSGNFPNDLCVWTGPIEPASGGRSYQLRNVQGAWILHIDGSPQYSSTATWVNCQNQGSIVLREIPIQITGQPVYYGNVFPSVSSVTIRGN